MLRIIFIFIFAVLITSNIAKSQTYDNELWGSLNFEIPVIEDFEIEISRELRLFNDLNDIKWHITDIDFKYDFSKHFALSFKYRYKYYHQEWQKVYYLNSNFDYKIWKIKTAYRLRFQKKNRFEQKSDYVKTKRDEDYIRNRLQFEYDTDSWIKPYIGCEIFYLFDNEKYSDRFSVIRYIIGVNIDIKKKHKLEIFLMNEREFNIENPNISNIIGIQYTYRLPKLFK